MIVTMLNASATRHEHTYDKYDRKSLKKSRMSNSSLLTWSVGLTLNCPESSDTTNYDKSIYLQQFYEAVPFITIRREPALSRESNVHAHSKENSRLRKWAKPTLQGLTQL